MKKNKLLEYSSFYTILFIVLIIDQLTKCLASIFLIKDVVILVPEYVFLSYTQNTGAAWSLFQNNSTLLGLLGIIVLIMIFAIREHLEVKKTKNQIIYGLICAGIIGNIIDRLLYGNVIDFIAIRIDSYHWPIFNIADSAICCGVLLCFLFAFSQKNKTRTNFMFY